MCNALVARWWRRCSLRHKYPGECDTKEGTPSRRRDCVGDYQDWPSYEVGLLLIHWINLYSARIHTTDFFIKIMFGGAFKSWNEILFTHTFLQVFVSIGNVLPKLIDALKTSQWLHKRSFQCELWEASEKHVFFCFTIMLYFLFSYPAFNPDQQKWPLI